MQIGLNFVFNGDFIVSAKLSQDILLNALTEFKNANGNISEAARRLGISRTTFQHWINEARKNKIIGESSQLKILGYEQPSYATRFPIDIENGMVVIFSDAHFWPGIISTANLALIKFLKEFSKDIKAIICNGDALDGASISRHSPLAWEERPTLIQEIETCTDRLHEIIEACPKALRIWPIGNHDARFEARLALQAPEYANIHGMHLKDHFPLWENAMSCWINDDIVVKHRYKGGIHATHNNVVNAGKTIITGHLHSLKVMPFTTYSEFHDSWPITKFGVDTGTLADPFGKQFRYSEDNPLNHRSGFVVLTFNKGRLAWPEIVHVVEGGVVEFRGQFWNV